MDRIVAAKVHLSKAQEMAFKVNQGCIKFHNPIVRFCYLPHPWEGWGEEIIKTVWYNIMWEMKGKGV